MEQFFHSPGQLRHIAAGGLFQLCGHVVEALGHDRVQGHEWPRDRLARADGTELELVAGEGKRARTVAVASVFGQRGQRVDAHGQRASRLGARRLAFLDLLEHIRQLFAEENRDDRRRGLVGTEPVVVAAGRYDGPQQIGVQVHRTDHRGAEHQELHVGVWCLARLQEVAEPAADRPVDVLARAVDPREGLLVQQAGHAVLLRDTRQNLHDRLLVVGRDVGVFIERRDFVLAGRHLVVPGLDGYAELEELPLPIEHAGQYPLGDRAEVLVLEFLPLRRLGTEERAAGHCQVGASEEEVAVDQEVFLLRTARGCHLADVLVAKHRQHATGLLVDRLH